MANTVQLLRHVRRALGPVAAATSAAYQPTLVAVDVALNALMLQQSPEFYLGYLARGEALLGEGSQLAAGTGAKLPALPPLIAVDEHSRPEDIHGAIDRLHERLVIVITALEENRSPQEKDYFVRLSDWENSLYQYRLNQAPVEPTTEHVPLTRDTVSKYLKARFPEHPDLVVTAFHPLEGGFSKQTILLETQDAMRGTQALVIRAETTHKLIEFEGSDVTQEFHMIELMRAAGLPVAEPLWLEADRSHLGTRFIVSRRAVGKTYGGNLGSAEQLSPAMLQSILGTLIKMHGVQVDPDNRVAQQSHLREWLPLRTVTETLRYVVTVHMPSLLRLANIPMTPQLLRGFKWIERNVPDCPEPPVIVHQDFALNNLILDGQRVTAVLDWESSRMGDPAEDLVWTQQNLREYISMPQLLTQYEAATGRRVTPFRLAYARVVRCALNALTCLGAMRALDNYEDPQLKLAILAYQYMAWFGSQFNELIADAERSR